MASAPTLELDRLLAPIPGADPAGSPPPFDLLHQLDEKRREGDPFGPPKVMDWNGIVQLATDALENTTKDVLVAARLTEGITQQVGFAGLRDGLTLLTRLFEECWDRLRPVPEEGEGFDVRGGPLLWLNDAGRGSRFPYHFATVGLLTIRGEKFTHGDWRGPRKAEFEAALSAVDHQKLRDLRDDLKEARVVLERLGKVVDEKMPDLGINLTGGLGTIGSALADVTETVGQLVAKVGLRDDTAPAAAAEEAAPEVGPAAGPAAAKPAGLNRADLYRQIDSIAELLLKLEPHSPIPYLLKRAVRLGALPFPQLMRAIVEESKPLDILDKLLGIETPSE